MVAGRPLGAPAGVVAAGRGGPRPWCRRRPPAWCWHRLTPTRVVDDLHGISAPTRVVDMSARYIPLAVSTTPSRCQQPPHVANNARPCRRPPSRSRQDASVPTTRARARVQGALRPRKGRVPDRHPRGTHTRGLIYETRCAHNGLIPPLCAVRCCLIPALVCGTKKGRGVGPGGTGEPERRTRARTRARGARAPADRKAPCFSARRPGWGTLHWSPVGTEPLIA